MINKNPIIKSTLFIFGIIYVVTSIYYLFNLNYYKNFWLFLAYKSITYLVLAISGSFFVMFLINAKKKFAIYQMLDENNNGRYIVDKGLPITGVIYSRTLLTDEQYENLPIEIKLLINKPSDKETKNFLIRAFYIIKNKIIQTTDSDAAYREIFTTILEVLNTYKYLPINVNDNNINKLDLYTYSLKVVTEALKASDNWINIRENVILSTDGISNDLYNTKYNRALVKSLLVPIIALAHQIGKIENHILNDEGKVINYGSYYDLSGRNVLARMNCVHLLSPEDKANLFYVVGFYKHLNEATKTKENDIIYAKNTEAEELIALLLHAINNTVSIANDTEDFEHEKIIIPELPQKEVSTNESLIIAPDVVIEKEIKINDELLEDKEDLEMINDTSIASMQPNELDNKTEIANIELPKLENNTPGNRKQKKVKNNDSDHVTFVKDASIIDETNNDTNIDDLLSLHMSTLNNNSKSVIQAPLKVKPENNKTIAIPSKLEENLVYNNMQAIKTTRKETKPIVEQQKSKLINKQLELPVINAKPKKPKNKLLDISGDINDL